MRETSQLPYEIRKLLPREVIHTIYSFISHEPKTPPKTPSPNLQKELMKIQSLKLSGKSAMYMRELEDFCLD